MKFLIEGREYDLKNGISKATLYTLYELKCKYGIGIKSLVAASKKMGAVSDPMDFLEDEQTFQTFLAVIWLARRYAGEKLTLEQANDFAMDSITVEQEDGDEETLDPKGQTVSVPAVVIPPKPEWTK